MFRETFTSLSHVNPEVLYPSLNTDKFEAYRETHETERNGDRFTFLSINRYERKKNLELAVKAFREYFEGTFSSYEGFFF